MPIYVDEDCHTLADVAACAERAHGINIKLAKSGGIREAVRMAHAARALGLGVMLGCMVESGLGIAAGAHIASLCDHVDLDGNLLLADDPWPGVAFVDGVQLPSEARASVSRPRRLLLLAEGHSGDPHHGKTARGVMRYRPEHVVALLDSERAGESEEGFPIVGTVEDALPFGATTALVGVATSGRPLPARLARAPAELHPRRARHRERPARVRLRRRRAVRARRARTASSSAICASRRRA